MIEYALLLLVPVFAWLDRQRGTPSPDEVVPKIVALAGIGLVVAFLAGVDFTWQLPVFALIVAVGSGILGIGHPLGWALTGKPKGEIEGWQKGPLAENPWLALAAYGTLIGLLTLAALDWRASGKVMLALTIAYPLAPLIVRGLDSVGLVPPKQAWGFSEYIRGGLIALTLWVLL